MKINEVIENINPETFLKQKRLIKKIADDKYNMDQELFKGLLSLMKEIQSAAEEELGMCFAKEKQDVSDALSKVRKKLPNYSHFTDHEGTEYIVCEHFGNGTSSILSANTISETMSFGENNNYKHSNYRQYLNNQYLCKLERAFGAENIVPHLINHRYGYAFDKVSIRTHEEYMQYKDGIGSFHAIEPLVTSKGNHDVLLVWSDQRITHRPCTYKYKIRPFFDVKTEALLPFICKEKQEENTQESEAENSEKRDILTLKFHGQSDDTFQCYDKIFAICNSLKPEERLNVEEFGSQHDLTLSIEKDSDYDVLTGVNNLVDIVTSRNGKAVDDACGIYVTDGQLLRELARIYNYRNFSTL